MKKLAVKFLILFLLCAVLVVSLNFITRNNDGHYVYRMMNEMYDSEENIDILFLGSSHTYRCYDPKSANQLLGAKTFNAGTSSQGMNTSYYLLREISKYHQLKTVYLDTYCGISSLAENDNQVYIASDYMKPGLNKTKLLLSNGGIQTLVNGYITANRGDFHIIKNIKSNFSEISDYSSISYKNEEYRGDGFVYSFETINPKDQNVYSSYADAIHLNEKKPLSDQYRYYLNEIIDFCKENKIELILVNQPIPRETAKLISNYNSFVKEIYQLARDNGLKYWNFDFYNGDMGLTPTSYKDGGHLNGKGAEQFTTFFCNFANTQKGNSNYEKYFNYPV